MAVLIMLIGVGLVYLVIERLYTLFWNKNLEAEVHFSKEHVLCGEELAIIETVTNGKCLPLPYVNLKFTLDRHIRFLQEDGSGVVSDYVYRNDIFSLLYYQKITRQVPIRCVQRGVYRIGTFDLVSTGAFMNDSLHQMEKSTSVLTVYPTALSVRGLSVYFLQLLGMQEKNRHVYEDPFVFRGIRDYQSYDSMKMVNWKATARANKLCVNQYNETVSQEVCILLDLEPCGMLFHDAVFEESISIAAGLVEHFLEQGILVSLYSNGKDMDTKDSTMISGGMGLAHSHHLNTALARMEHTSRLEPFVDILQKIPEEEKKQKLYVMVAANNESALVDAYATLAGAGGMWIVPYLHGDESHADNIKKNVPQTVPVVEWEAGQDGR